jgi:cystathionine beta-lyase
MIDGYHLQRASPETSFFIEERTTVMENFDFDRLIERRGTLSYKWESCPDPDVLPMWVADMDFMTAPAIIEALQKRVAHGIFGYASVPPEFYEAVCSWHLKRHGWRIKPEEIQYTTGVVPAMSAVIKAFTKPGDKVAIHTPAYNCFFSSIRNNGCTAAETPLVQNGLRWEMNYEEIDRILSDPAVKIFLLCSPQNPVGRVWTREELVKLIELCKKHGVILCTDEIHEEFVYPGHTFIPVASLPEADPMSTVTLTAPSKAFNTAGLQLATIICANPEMRKKIDRAVNDNECCDVSPLGVTAAMAAYEKGAPWLDALLVYLRSNADFVEAYFSSFLPGFTVSPLEGTYLMWIDCRKKISLTSQQIEESLIKNEKIWINAGTHYGAAGEGFIRLNIACPRARLEEGLKRLEKGLKRLSNS